MGLTRRQFIKRTGLATAASFFGPALFRHPFVSRALADTLGDRYFVLVFLDGGNDGLKTVVPYDNGGGLRNIYNAKRSSINLAPSSLLVPTPPLMSQALKNASTNTQLGLHPGLAGIRNLYNLGKVAVIQGCGYPDYSLSHDQSRTIWQTANPLGYGPYAGTGWVGRHLAG